MKLTFKHICCTLSAITISGYVSAQTLWAPGGTVGTSTNGNVGIGTSSPSAILEIGTPTSTQILNIGTVGNRANTNVEIRESMAVLGDSATSQSVLGATAWNYYNNGVGASFAGSLLTYFGQSYAGDVYGTTAAGQGALVFQNTSSGVIATNGTVPIHIAPHASTGISTTFAANGNVGIGTTSPTWTLHIKDSTANIALDGSSGGHRAVRFQTNGAGRFDVGINSSPESGSNVGSDYYINAFGDTGNYLSTVFFIKRSSGNVGIGTMSPSHKLAVNGTIRAKEVIIDTGWADYVFEEDYHLMPLSEVENHIEENGHLPGVPAAEEVHENGIGVGEVQSLLLAKLEELTLHLIAQEKRIAALEAENATLKNQPQF